MRIIALYVPSVTERSNLIFSNILPPGGCKMRHEYKIKYGNQLIKNTKLIKILEEDEISDAEILIDALNNFELFPEDPEIDNLFDPSDYWLKNTNFDREDYNKIVIPLLLMDDHYIMENILENENISDLMQRMRNNSLYVMDDRSDVEDDLAQMMQTPDHLRSYVDYNSLTQDLVYGGDAGIYSIKLIPGENSISKFFIYYFSMEDYFYQLKI